MGINVSKPGHTFKDHEPDQGSVPSTPILTPKNRDFADLDPRSPSANIVRTPIQLSNALNKLQTPIIGEINTSFEAHTDEDTFENTNILLDPRSPSVDFTRTPIVTEKSGVKFRNKNLDKLKKLTIEYSPVKIAPKVLENEPNKIEYLKNKGPILLESSPIVKKVEDFEKRKSYIGLLETNLDFLETNLDTVGKKLETELQINEKVDLPILEEEKCSESEALEPKFVEKVEEKLTQIEEELREVIEVTVDPTIELDKSKLEVIVEQEILKTPIKAQKSLETENPVLDFDKKITNLIYEDQSHQILSPKQNKLSNNRTPLGDRNRNTNSNLKTSRNKLKVHDRPTKNQYSVSKIPVFKDKKSNQNCENTPPTNTKKSESSVKRSMWDSNDKTLII